MRVIEPKFLRRWVKHLKAHDLYVGARCGVPDLLQKAHKDGHFLTHEEFFSCLRENLHAEKVSQITHSAIRIPQSAIARDAYFELDERPKKRLIVRLKPDVAQRHECHCRGERPFAPTEKCTRPLCQCETLTTQILGDRGQETGNRKTPGPYFAIGCLAQDADSLCKHPDIEFAEEDARIEAFAEQLSWGYTKIKAIDAYNFGLRGQGVKVAVIDTGIDYNHEDLKGLYKGGYDFVNGDSDPMDDHWHGTHVAGILCARANETGYRGVAPQVELYAVKVLSATGIGYWSDVAAGIDWCRQNGIKVINMSLGGYEYSQAVKDACDNAKAAGVTLVAAAGNGGNWGWGISSVSYPAKFDSVIAVTAMFVSGELDNLPVFSSIGPEVDLSAPGVDIPSSVPLWKDPSGYKNASGTSMASPHVAALATVVKQARPKATPDEIKQILLDSAIKYDATYNNTYVMPGWWTPNPHPWLLLPNVTQAPGKDILEPPAIIGRNRIPMPYVLRYPNPQNGQTTVPVGNPIRFTLKSDTWGIDIEKVKVKVTDSWGVNVYDSTSPYFKYSGDRFSYDVEVKPPQPWANEEDVQVEIEAEDFMESLGGVYEYVP